MMDRLLKVIGVIRLLTGKVRIVEALKKCPAWANTIELY